jgi:lambda repressor-like predicted transcriptional regulator
VNDIAELKRQGLSIQAISAMTGFDRKTVKKTLRDRLPSRSIKRGRRSRANCICGYAPQVVPRSFWKFIDADREELTRIARRTKSAQALAMRARIVLGCE